MPSADNCGELPSLLESLPEWSNASHSDSSIPEDDDSIGELGGKMSMSSEKPWKGGITFDGE